ncbi:MAG: arylsulfatase, partial [Actinomycetota bacterium]
VIVEGVVVQHQTVALDDHTVVESTVEVPTGDSHLRARVTRTGRRTGTVELFIDDELVAAADLPFMMRMISSLGASLGQDRGSQVSARYDGPFPFSGTLHEVDFQVASRPKPDARDTATAARTEMSRQ